MIYSAVLFISPEHLSKSCIPQWAEASGANSPTGDLLFSKSGDWADPRWVKLHCSVCLIQLETGKFLLSPRLLQMYSQ